MEQSGRIPSLTSPLLPFHPEFADWFHSVWLAWGEGVHSVTKSGHSHSLYRKSSLMKWKELSCFSILTTLQLEQASHPLPSLPITSDPVHICRILHHTINNNGFSPINICGSSASLPLFPGIQGQGVDRQSYEENFGSISRRGRDDWGFFPTFYSQSDTCYWFLVLESATANTAGIWHTAQQMGSYELLYDVRWKT